MSMQSGRKILGVRSPEEVQDVQEDRDEVNHREGFKAGDWLWAILVEAERKEILIGPERGAGGAHQRREEYKKGSGEWDAG